MPLRPGAVATLRFFFVVHPQADGNRVKSALNGETVIYVGNLYEKKVVGSTTTHTKYDYFGGRRIAVRVAGTLSWLLSDHLGSTAVTADGATGARTGELWYKPWGESRGNPFGATPTAHRFPGQREEAGIRLYFYSARTWDPCLLIRSSRHTRTSGPTETVGPLAAHMASAPGQILAHWLAWGLSCIA